MFQNLTKNFAKIFDKLKHHGALTEKQIDEAMRDIRIALLEADVALATVRDFIANIKEKAMGQEVIKSVSPAQMIIKIVNDEMIKFLAPPAAELELNLATTPPANILIVGLQGSGKTTASAKLALRLKKTNKKPLLVSLDIYRPAAQEQLGILAANIDVDSLPIIAGQSPEQITERAMIFAKKGGYDVVIYDSAGRLHIDEAMIAEMATIKAKIKPTETLLVLDAMIGQDAINVANKFDMALNISGAILSRIDGDARGGAALSVRHVTGKPIKFLSTGEKLEEFEEFDAKRLTSRILDMGDIVSLVEKAKENIDQLEAEKTAARLQKGKFDLNDYLAQIKMVGKLGGFGNMLSLLPGATKIAAKLGDNGGAEAEKLFKKQGAIISSMTKKERVKPDILNASRRKRIAMGAGVSIQEVNKLLKQFKQISTSLKKLSKMNPKAMMRNGGPGGLFSKLF